MDEAELKDKIKRERAADETAQAEIDEVKVEEAQRKQDEAQHRENMMLAAEEEAHAENRQREHEAFLEAEEEKNRKLAEKEDEKNYKRLLRMHRKDNRSYRQKKPRDNYDRKSDAFELVIGGLMLWIFQIFWFQMGSIPIPTQAWLSINLLFSAIAIFLCKLNEYEVGIIFLVQTGMPYYMPFIRAALSNLAFGSQSIAAESTIGLLTLPGLWPVWFLYSVRFHQGVWVRRFYKLYVFFLALLIVGLAVEAGVNHNLPTPDALNYEPEAYATSIKQMASNFWSSIVGAKAAAEEAWVNQLNYATGGLYESRVDKEEKVPLGVYIESVDPAMPMFFSNEEVLVFAKVRAKTPDIDEKVMVQVSCNVKSDDETIRGELRPRASAHLGKDESINFQCWFGEGVLPLGDSVVNVDVNFSFTTRSSLKRYFLEGTVFNEKFERSASNVWATPPYSSIVDKRPVTRVSNAPVRVTMAATDTEIIGIYRTDSEENFWQPRFTILIQKIWDGNLKQINTMELSLPAGLKIDRCFPGFDQLREEEGRLVYGLKAPIAEKLNVEHPINCIIDVTNPEALIGPPSAADTPPLSLGWFRLETNYTYEVSASQKVKIVEPRQDETQPSAPPENPSDTPTTVQGTPTTIQQITTTTQGPTTTIEVIPYR
jgi:hypothetical protein